MRIIPGKEASLRALEMMALEFGQPISGTLVFARDIANRVELEACGDDAGLDERRAWLAYRGVVDDWGPSPWMVAGALQILHGHWVHGDALRRLCDAHAQGIHREQGRRVNAMRAEWVEQDRQRAEKKREEEAAQTKNCIPEVTWMPPARGSR